MRAMLIIPLFSFVLTGCATKEFVLDEAAKVDRRVAALERAMATSSDRLGAEIKQVDSRLGQTQGQLTVHGQQVEGLLVNSDEQRKTLTTHTGRLQAGEQRLALVVQDLSGTAQHLKQTAAQQTTTAAMVSEVRGHLHSTQSALEGTKGMVAAQGDRLQAGDQVRASIAMTANDALARAMAAGKLAEGKLMYATALTQNLTGFVLDHAVLSVDAKQAIRTFAEQLKAENANVYLEIQGHTDSSGNAAGNHRLAYVRAEIVRDFLYHECGIPLHRMTVFSYGSAQPIADNKTRAGRVQNRRVALIVLK